MVAVAEPRRHPDAASNDNAPAVRMREYLATAKRAGKDFHSVWQFAKVNALHGTSQWERGMWSEAFDATMTAWRDAYCDLPNALTDRLAVIDDGNRVVDDWSCGPGELKARAVW